MQNQNFIMVHKRLKNGNNLIHFTTWNYEIERNYLYLIFHLREKVTKHILGLNKYAGKVSPFELFVNKKYLNKTKALYYPHAFTAWTGIQTMS